MFLKGMMGKERFLAKKGGEGSLKSGVEGVTF